MEERGVESSRVELSKKGEYRAEQYIAKHTSKTDNKVSNL